MEIKTLIGKVLGFATLLFCVLGAIEMVKEIFRDPDMTMFILMKLGIYISIIVLMVSSKFSMRIKSNVPNGFLLAFVSIGTIATIIMGYFIYYDFEKHFTEMSVPLVYVLYNIFYALFSGLSNSPIRSLSEYLRVYMVGIVLWAVSLISLLVCFFAFFLDPDPSQEDQIMTSILVLSTLAQIIYLAIIIIIHKGKKYIWASSIIYFFGMLTAFAVTLYIIWIAIILVVGYFIIQIVLNTGASGSRGGGGSCSSCGNWRGGICLAGRNVSNPGNQSCSQHYNA